MPGRRELVGGEPADTVSARSVVATRVQRPVYEPRVYAHYDQHARDDRVQVHEEHVRAHVHNAAALQAERRAAFLLPYERCAEDEERAQDVVQGASEHRLQETHGSGAEHDSRRGENAAEHDLAEVRQGDREPCCASQHLGARAGAPEQVACDEDDRLRGAAVPVEGDAVLRQDGQRTSAEVATRAVEVVVVHQETVDVDQACAEHQDAVLGQVYRKNPPVQDCQQHPAAQDYDQNGQVRPHQREVIQGIVVTAHAMSCIKYPKYTQSKIHHSRHGQGGM